MKSARVKPNKESFREAEATPQFRSSNKIVSLHEEYSRRLGVFGKLLHERGYVSGCDGNLSVRLGEHHVLVTPTGCSKAFLEPQDMVVVDLKGTKIDGRRAPTSEIGMHLTIYRHRPDINAVVHAHPCVSTGFASAGLGIVEPICTELVLTLGEVPLARYAPPGTPDLSRSIEPFIAGHHAILLQNHGVVTYANTLEQAYLHMETVEHSARILLITKLLSQYGVGAGLYIGSRFQAQSNAAAQCVR